jgi:hypothetical protein
MAKLLWYTLLECMLCLDHFKKLTPVKEGFDDPMTCLIMGMPGYKFPVLGVFGSGPFLNWNLSPTSLTRTRTGNFFPFCANVVALYTGKMHGYKACLALFHGKLCDHNRSESEWAHDLAIVIVCGTNLHAWTPTTFLGLTTALATSFAASRAGSQML